ncbi:MAG: AAA family ATPase [Acetobacteraceae bacterium]|nr:AAA family ATPase [Acetobacteraceae bacterium]MDW8397919.1 cellulose synthase operon protein YhjQ/BcsQ [Acetobacteraceae bacterium]
MPLLLVASPKGGVGKTTVSAGLADAFARAGRRVIALDLDPQNALRLHFGVPVQDHTGFVVALPRGADWRAFLRPTESGVLLLPHGGCDLRSALDLHAAIGREPDLLAAPVRQMLAESGTIVVADLPPGASPVLAALAPLASLVLVVLLPDSASTALLPEISQGRFLGRGTLAALGAPPLYVVLNQVDHASALSRRTAEAVARHLGPRLLGAIAREDSVPEALAWQRPLLRHAPGSAAARDLADLSAAVLPLLQPTTAPAPAAAAAPPILGIG